MDYEYDDYGYDPYEAMDDAAAWETEQVFLDGLYGEWD